MIVMRLGQILQETRGRFVLRSGFVPASESLERCENAALRFGQVRLQRLARAPRAWLALDGNDLAAALRWADDFDAAGAVYDGLLDNGQPIDDSGEFVETSLDGPSDLDGAFHGAVDMMTRLAGSPQVRACVTLQQFRYALGRPEAEADACAAQAIHGDFSASDFNLQALMIAIVRSDAFRTHVASAGGAACR